MTKKEENELDELTYKRERKEKADAAKRAIYEVLPYLEEFSVWELCYKSARALSKIASKN